MKLNEVLRTAEQVGLIVEPLELGYRVREADGRLIGNHWPKDRVEAFILNRQKIDAGDYDRTGLCGTAFPPF
jgi:hypothetical protein